MFKTWNSYEALVKSPQTESEMAAAQQHLQAQTNGLDIDERLTEMQSVRSQYRVTVTTTTQNHHCQTQHCQFRQRGTKGVAGDSAYNGQQKHQQRQLLSRDHNGRDDNESDCDCVL